MKQFTFFLQFIISTTILASHTATAQEQSKVNKSNRSDQNRVPTVRLYAELYEISTLEYADIMSQNTATAHDNSLRNKLFSMAKNGTSKLIDSQTLTTRVNQYDYTESITEFTFPTEYDPPSTDLSPGNLLELTATPTAFETRNLGSRLSVKTNIHSDSAIHAAIEFEHVTHMGETHWMNVSKNKSLITLPMFYNTNFNTELKLPLGKFILASVFTPLDKDKKPDRNKKTLYFIKANILEEVK